jgi:hypothetical protein
MDLGSIFLILALIVLVGLFISRPFLRSQVVENPRTDTEQHRSALLAERDRLLNALQELDFDQGLGKIPAEDYPEMRSDLTRRAAGVLRELDLDTTGPTIEKPEDWVERAVAARRADAFAANASAANVPAANVPVANAPALVTPAIAGGGTVAADEVEELIARRRNQRQERSAGFCPKCGKPVQKSDRFCSRCGQTL